MAVIKKTLFPKNLDRYSVFVTDTDPSSRYFKITELPDSFTGGKNAFLIAGSEELLADTKIQIELKDAAGDIIYHEPGEGIVSSSINGQAVVTEYFEGVSKVVSVYIYPETAYGPCTLTILGELSKYEDGNGIINPIPIDWEGKYNVKWQKQINVNPSLANTTKIRFYQRPTATIKEILSPIYRIENDIKVNSGVSQSFADIKLSKLETFAGDVKRIKVFRTSEGDISDYDLIQDILVESKELLTSYGLTGSVVGQTGILTSETLKNFWNTGSLNAYLTSSRVESGVRLTGSGYFTYTSSLDIKSTNTYELNLDAFYSSSTSSNLGIYLMSGSMSSSIGTLYGITPTKNLLDTVIPFKISTDYPSASLYFSQSQGEWHLGNISLKLSQDTAFSPDEVSFITTMPTVIGNETFNFKFEFYDVNNNYVPVAVTQSATFTGGVNVNNTLLLVSSSTSQSLAALYAVSSSISGTMTVYSSSASSSVNVLSGSVSGTIGSVSSSVSGTIGRVSGSISGSIYSLSGSVSSSLTLTSGSIILLSGSFLQFTQSITSSLTSLSQSVSSSFFNVSGAINAATASLSSSMSASLNYQVYSASQYLDKFIFTDANGKVNQPPTASSPGLYLGSTYMGYYSGSGTSGWKTYMDDQGDFYLTSSVPNSGFLAWNASSATLQIQGSINIQGGNAATTTALSSSLNAVSGAINSATASLSTSVATTTFTTATGLIAKPPSVLVGSTSGLYLGSTYLGYYNGSAWKTYMADNGNFYLSGAGSDSLTWASGVLTINGAINITGGNVQTSLSSINSATASLNSATSSLNTSVSNINSSITNINSTTSSLDARIFTNSSGLVNKTPSASTSGLYLGSTYLGYYNGTAWKTYMDNLGKFYLSGTGTNGLTWDGSTLSIRGTIKVDDGTEVTAATVSGAASGATALQNGNTGKSLGLTGGSVGGVTIASNKIYVGTGTYGNTNTGFYVDSDGNMSLKDKLTWDGSTLSITGTVVITGGSTKTAIDSASTTATNAQNQLTTIGANSGSWVNPSSYKFGGGGFTLAGVSLSGAGLYLGSDYLGYYNGGAWKSYMDSSGHFYLAGSGNNGLSWDGADLSIDGNITARNGTFYGNITSTAVISGGTITGGTITGGSIAIGGTNFTVNSAGSLTANNASLTGYINATSGQIGSWVIDGTVLRDSDSKIKLDPAARSVNILKDGSVKTTLNGNTVLTDASSANVYLGGWSDINSQINTTFSITSNTTYTEAIYYSDWSANFTLTQAGPVKLNIFHGNIAVGGTFPTGESYCGGAGGGVSVTGDTLISMANGSYKLAKHILKGDLIKSWDWRNNKNEIIETPVTNISQRIAHEIYVVTIGDMILRVSNSHGFWLDDNTEIYVNDLIPGQSEIYVFDGNSIIKKIVDNVEIIYEDVEVFTLHVEETNNYISNGIVSHNPGGGTADYDGQRGYGSIQIYAELYNNTNGQSVLAYAGGATKYGAYTYCPSGIVGGSDYPLSYGYTDASFTIPSVGSYKWRYKIVISVTPSESANYYGRYTANSTTFTATVGNTSIWPYGSSPGTLVFPTNIVEVTNAGIQILNDQYTYLQMPRFDSSTSWNNDYLIKTLGGYGARFEGSYDSVYGYGRCLFLAGQVYMNDSLKTGFETSIFPTYDRAASCGSSGKRWQAVYAYTGTIQTSDRNQKKEIQETELGLNLINKLKPVKYKFIENESNRFHYGLIAQDVSGSLGELGIDTKDFAGFIETNLFTSGSYRLSTLNDLDEDKFNKSEWLPNKEYGLRYDEFISPMIKAIQQLSAKVDELEAKLSGSI